jgi:glycosyltransferase involved in cell wall biosynthesis
VPTDDDAMIAINARFQVQPLTGVQRVPTEILARMNITRLELRPRRPLSPIAGYVWEQLSLPLQVSGRLLWSPCNVGPIGLRHQVLTIHDAAVLDHPEWFSRNFVRAYRLIWSVLVPRVRQLVTVSNFSRKRLASHFGIEERLIEVVHNGVSEQFKPAPAFEIAKARERFQLGNGPYFLTLGTLEPRKNIRLVLEAWKMRGPGLKDAKLVLIGGHGSSQVFAHGGDPNPTEDILTPGRVPDEALVALLSGATALLYPSLYEGFGLPVLEAMACGTPVIAGRTDGIMEVARDAASYVEQRDAGALAELMAEIVASKHLAVELVGKGFERARAYSWQNSANGMEQILRRYM